MKKFCEFLKGRIMEKANLTRRKMMLLTNAQQELYRKEKPATFVKTNLLKKLLVMKNIVKLTSLSL